MVHKMIKRGSASSAFFAYIKILKGRKYKTVSTVIFAQKKSERQEFNPFLIEPIKVIMIEFSKYEWLF